MSNENKPMEVILKETPDIDISFETVVYQGNNVGVLKDNSINNYAQQLINGTLKFCGVTQNGTDSIILYDKDNNQFLIIKSNSSQFGKYNSETVLVSSSADLIHNRSGEGNFPVWDSFNLPISTVADLKSLVTDAAKKTDLLDLAKLPGVNTSDGYFSSTDSALLFEGDRSQEIYFHTPDLSLGIAQRIFSDRKFSGSHIQIYIDTDGSLGIWCGGSNIKIQGIESFSPYQVIVVFSETNNNATIYLNGVVKDNVSSFAGLAAPSGYYIGSNGDDLSNSFKGIIYYSRLFNYALSAEEVTALWNNGNPAGYVLPTSGNLRTGCAAEYLPGNITTSQWIDSSGNNLDLTASGRPQLVNYNIYPTYYATKEDLENEIKLKAKRDIVAAGNNISNNQLMVINDESSITISCDNLEDGATADIRAKGNTIITFTDSNRQIRYIKSYDTIDAASTDIVIYSLMCSNDEVYITRAIF